MELQAITPLILTYNEAANIKATLDGLKWARRIVVIDSGSTDGTLERLSQYPGVQIEHRQFDNFASQCNYGLQFITTPWVLSIDADYRCSEELRGEIVSLPDSVNGIEFSFVYCIYGRPLRASLYPPRIVLFRTSVGRYECDGHAHRVVVKGPILRARSAFLHDDRKPLARWLESQAEYADLEVQKLLSTPHAELSWKDRLRKKIFFAPVLTLLYCLFGKGLLLDGWPGIYYTLQRMYAELLLSMKLLDAKLAEGREQNGRAVEQ